MSQARRFCLPGVVYPDQSPHNRGPWSHVPGVAYAAPLEPAKSAAAALEDERIGVKELAAKLQVKARRARIRADIVSAWADMPREQRSAAAVARVLGIHVGRVRKVLKSCKVSLTSGWRKGTKRSAAWGKAAA